MKKIIEALMMAFGIAVMLALTVGVAAAPSTDMLIFAGGFMAVSLAGALLAVAKQFVVLGVLIAAITYWAYWVLSPFAGVLA